MTSQRSLHKSSPTGEARLEVQVRIESNVSEKTSSKPVSFDSFKLLYIDMISIIVSCVAISHGMIGIVCGIK